MKHNIFLTAMLAMAIGLSSCSDDEDESCSADEDICTVVVTVCCTSETECKYQVGDEEYDSFEEASKDSECTASKAPVDVENGLKALAIRAKANF